MPMSIIEPPPAIAFFRRHWPGLPMLKPISAMITRVGPIPSGAGWPGVAAGAAPSLESCAHRIASWLLGS